jgi:phosphomannomutase
MNAVAAAALAMGYRVLNGGQIPSPAIALWGLQEGIPSVMVTGSHIPADRNGIKFNKCVGEVLKSDEAGITDQEVDLPAGVFDPSGMLLSSESSLGDHDRRPLELYRDRYRNTFPSTCLKGKRIGLYQHSAVGREVLVDIFEDLGASVTKLGYSDTFMPVDTEAIREEDVVLAEQWSREHGFDIIISTDGDSDRPLISDEHGNWLRGDVAGILAARYLGAQVVSTPVSCNTAVDLCGDFSKVCRTKIGSPHVIAAMMEVQDKGHEGIVGYEANGGFLTQSTFEIQGKTLGALPTRDAVLPALCVLLLSIKEGQPISKLCSELPQRFTVSGRLQDFPLEKSSQVLSHFTRNTEKEECANLQATFPGLGEVERIDRLDGLRVHFSGGDIVHLRPSGNAPEFRCYVESSSLQRSEGVRDQVLKTLLDF